MGIYYKLLDYPRIPDHLLSSKFLENDQRVHTGNAADGTRMKYTVDAQEISAITYSLGYPDNPFLVNWVMNNLTIPSTSKKLELNWKLLIKDKIKIRIQEGNPNTLTGFRVHADYNSVAAIMYFWDLGGDNVKTSWWKWKDPSIPLVSQSRSFRENPRVGTENGPILYKDIELIESVVAQPHQWYLYCGAVLHDVQNVTGTRKYVSVSFNSFEQLSQFGFDSFGLTF